MNQPFLHFSHSILKRRAVFLEFGQLSVYMPSPPDVPTAGIPFSFCAYCYVLPTTTCHSTAVVFHPLQ